MTAVQVRRVEGPGSRSLPGFRAYLAGGRLLVPARLATSHLGLALTWDPARGLLWAEGRSQALPFELPVGAGRRRPFERMLRRDQLFLPVRVLAELAGLIPEFHGPTGRLSLRHPVGRGRQAQPARPERRSRQENGTSVVHRGIWATSEEPQRTSGPGPRGDHWLRATDQAAALPDRSALGRWITVRYPQTGRQVTVPVVDVGPWNVDDPYWIRPGARPQAERSDRDRRGRRTNGAGLDLSYGAWVALGVPWSRVLRGDLSGRVDWWFSEAPTTRGRDSA